MALEYVGGKTASITGSTTTATNISLTDLTGGLASSPAAGDIVIVAYATRSTLDRSIGVNTSGYTEVTELFSNDTADTNLSVSWKIMGSTPDSTAQVSATGSTDEPGAVSVHVWRGIDSSTPLDVAATTATGANSFIPNPPAITPITSGAIILAIGAGAATAAPNNIGTLSSGQLSNFITLSTATSSMSVGVGMGSFAWTSGAFDPNAFSVTGTNSSVNSNASVTLALRPAAESGGGGLTATGSGTLPISGTGTATVSSGGSAPASSLSFLEGRASSANASSYTFSAVSLGTAASARRIVVAVSWRSAGTTNDVTAVTVAGVSASLVADARNTGGSNLSVAEIWIADVPTGTSGDIVVTTSAEAVRLGIAAYALTGANALRTTSTQTSASTGSVTLSDTLNLPSAAHVIGVTFNGAGQSWISSAHDDLASGSRSVSVSNASTNATWTGLTEDYDAVLEGTNSSYSAAAFAAWDVVEESGSGAITATGSGTVPITGSGNATVAVAGAASGTIALAGTGAATVAVQGSGSGSIALTGAGSAAVAVAASGSGTLDITGTGTAELVNGLTASGSGVLGITGSGAASVSIAAAGSGPLSLTGTGAASVAISGSGAGAIAISGTGAGTVASTAIGSGTLSLVGSGTGIIRVAGAGSGVLPLSGAGAASVAITASGSGQIDITGSGSAGSQDVATASGSGTISLTGSGAATVSISATGAGSIALSGSGAGTVTVAAVGSGVIALAGSGGASVSLSATGAGVLGLSGTAQAGVAIEGSGAGVLPITGSGVAAVLVPAPVSAERRFTVAAETRLFAVHRDAIRSTVAAEPRRFAVPYDPRAFTVPAEQRRITITERLAA